MIIGGGIKLGFSVERCGGAVVIMGGVDKLGCCCICGATVDVAAAPNGGGGAELSAYKDCRGDDDGEADGSMTAGLPSPAGGCC